MVGERVDVHRPQAEMTLLPSRVREEPARAAQPRPLLAKAVQPRSLLARAVHPRPLLALLLWVGQVAMRVAGSLQG